MTKILHNLKHGFTLALMFASGVIGVAHADPAATALPTGGQVVSGDASIASTGATLNVNQTSQRAIVNWDSFHVGKDATVNFNQPSSSASTLNKINGANPSQIFGKINAPGEVILQNTAGVYFSPSASLDVGSLTATSHTISNDDYNSGKYHFDRNGSTGAVVNEGTIKAGLKGYVALLAPEVRNGGVIVAQLGTVAMASGERVTLNFDTNSHLASITTTAATINTLIENKSAVNVNGGQIILSAKALNALVSGVIKQSGTLDASNVGTKFASVGGRIVIEGDHVTLAAGSQTLAKGSAAGGSVTITATKTLVTEATSVVNVSSVDAGQGGAIKTTAPTTQLAGAMIANGGAQSGNGGSVQTNAQTLVVATTATVNTNSQDGVSAKGTWTTNMPSISVDTNMAKVISATLNTSHVTLNAITSSFNLVKHIVIEKVAGDSTNLDITAQTDINISGAITSDTSTPFNVTLVGGQSIVLDTFASVKAANIAMNAPTISAGGDLYAFGNSGNGSSLFLALVGARLSVTGNLRARQNQNNTGSILLSGSDEVAISSSATINMSDENGGSVDVISDSGNITIAGSILTNGENGRGGSINVLANQSIAISSTNLFANGTTDGGTVKIISTSDDVNLQNSIIQTNGGSGLGGTILISGLDNTLISNTTIQATGFTNGGTIKIGYDAINQSIPFSSFTNIDSASVLNANQLDSNASNQNGGYIETSGQTLSMLAAINAGRGGMWLLDPYDVTIASSGATGTSYSSSFTAGATTTILASAINASLNAGTNVSITTGSSSANTIYVNSEILATTGSATFTLTGGTINLAANITTRGSQTYTGAVLINNASGITLTSTNSNITFSSTVNSVAGNYYGLTISNGSGTTTFSGIVGASSGTSALGYLCINATGCSSISGVAPTLSTGTTILYGNVTTNGTQIYGGAVSLNGAAISLTTNDGLFNIVGALNVIATVTTSYNILQFTGYGGYIYNGTSAATLPSSAGTISWSGTSYTWTPSTSASNSKLLIVGGGGGGTRSANTFSGGAGGGGVIYDSAYTVLSSPYTITIGDGGRANASTNYNYGGSGGSTSVAVSSQSLTAFGGGGGSTFNTNPGVSGGSGGGAPPNANTPNSIANGGSATKGSVSGYSSGTLVTLGNDGGRASVGSNGLWTGGGGGGGAGAAGTAGSNGGTTSGNTIGGNGGVGYASNITGTSVTYASGAAGTGWQSVGTSGTGAGVTSGNANATTASSPTTPGSAGANAVIATAGAKGIVVIALAETSTSYASTVLTINAGTGKASIGGTVSNISTLAINSKSALSAVLGAIGGATLVSYNTATGYTGSSGAAGVLSLAGTNTYTGGTTVTGGILQAGSTTAFGASTSAITVNSGAALDLNGKTLTNTNALTLNGTGISGGGALTNSSTTAGTYAGTISLGSASIINASTGAITASGIISGANALTKIGSNTLTLSGANTYTGLTTISAGTLKLGAAGGGTNTPLGTTGAGTVVSDGATLDLNGYTLGTAEGLTLNGVGLSSAGALTNSSSTAVTYSGLISLGSASTINASSGNIVISNVGTITGATYGLTLTGTNTASSIASIIGTTSGTLTKSGTGTWTLSGANTYTGGTTISAGALKAGSAGALGTGAVSIAASGTLDLTYSGTVALGSTLSMSAGAAITNSANTSSLSVTGVSTLNGSINTAGNQTYTGAVTLGANTTLTTLNTSSVNTNGTITFSSTVDSTAGSYYGLSITNGTGTAAFGGIVGANSGTSALGYLCINASGCNASNVGTYSGTGTGTTTLAGNVTTSGNQTYAGSLTLGANTVLTSTANSGNGAVTVAGALNSGSSVGSAILEFLGGGYWEISVDGGSTWAYYNNSTYQSSITISGTTYTSSASALASPLSITYNAGSYSWTPSATTTASYLLVGGGGAGGYYGGAGGGGGGVLYSSNSFVSTNSYTIIVGAGGVGNQNNLISAPNGGSSSIAIGSNAAFVTAYGGGGGGTGSVQTGGSANNAASGGGASWAGASAGAGLSTQGNSGGSVGANGGSYSNGGNYGGGGGGGSSSSGAVGNGGDGVANPITGSNIGQLSAGTRYLAGGGGGSRSNAGSGGNGGLGGGGAGSTNGGLNYSAGMANTGGGGGGLHYYFNGATGGSGVVVLSGNIVSAQGTYSLTINAGTGKATIGGTVSNISTLAINSKSALSAVSGAIGGATLVSYNTATGYTGSSGAAGVLNLAGTNTYTGGTTVTGGTLQAGSTTAFGANASAITVNTDAVLDINGKTLTNTNALTLNGSGVSSAGALTNSSSTAATYTGLITLGSDASIGSTTGAINVTGAISSGGNSYKLALVGNQAITLSSASNTLSTIASGSGVGALSISNNQALTIGSMTIGGITYSGLSSTGTILVKTITGNLTVNNSVITTSTSSSTSAPAIKLSAGFSDATTSTTNNIILDSSFVGSSPTNAITAGTGAIIAMYSGSAASSTNLSVFTLDQSTYFTTYGVTTTTGSLATGAGYYALYRGTQPTLYVIFGSSNTPTFGTAPSITYTFNTLANGSGTSYQSSDTAIVNATGTALFKGTNISTSTSNISLNSSANAGSYDSVFYLSGLSSPVYTLSAGATAGTLTINKAQAYVMINSGQSSIYGATPTINYTYYNNAAGTGGSAITSLAGLTGTATITNAPTASSDAGTYNLTYASGLSSTNYAFNAAASSIAYTVSPKPITISNSVSSTTYDGVTSYATLVGNAGFTTNVSLVGSDAIGSLTQATTISGNSVSGVAQAGTYVSTPSAAVLSTGNLSNYTFTYMPATNTVSKANLSITGTASTSGNIYNGNTYTSAYTTSFLGSDAASATITGMVSQTNAGTYTSALQVSGSILSNYNTAVITNASYVISPKPITYTTAVATGTYGTLSILSTPSFTGLVGSDDPGATVTAYSGTTPITISATTNAGTYTQEVSALSNGNYAIASTGNTVGNLVISPLVISYTTTAATGTYGTLSTLSTATFAGLVGSDDPGATVTAYSGTTPITISATTNAGTYTQEVSALSNANYQLASTGNTIANLVISPLAITISNALSSTTYDGVTSYATLVGNAGFITNVSLVGSDAIGSLTQATTIGGNAVSGIAQAGTYVSTPSAAVLSTGNLSNYTFTYMPATNTVAKATLLLSGTQAYNGTATISGASLTVSGVGGESFTASGLADLTTKNVQTNQQLSNTNGLSITANGAATLDNYFPLSVANTSVSVSPLAITLTAPAITKTYDGGYTYNMTSNDLTAMSTQLVGGDRVTAASVVFTGNNPNVGTNKSVSLNSATISDGNSGSNYTVTLASSTTSEVTPVTLTVSANNASKFVTQSDTTGFNGVVYSGFVNGETASSALSGTLTVTRSNAATNAAGIYTGVLTPGGLTANYGNYTITPVAGNLTIIPADQLLVEITPVTTNYGTAPTYTATAQYLTCSVAGCPSSGSVNVIHTLSPVISGNAFSVSDGAGGSAAFTIMPVSATNSSSGNINVGGYQLSAGTVTGSSTNFSNTVSLTGALTVAPLTLAASQLGVSGVTKVYNGSNAISGLNLNTSASSSTILSGDAVTVMGTGTYADANVGTNKAVTVAVGLTGADAGNYVLSNNQINANIGTITQLTSVTYTGTSGGNWSNASNWAGGAIPTLSNVATVIIPTATTVVYDAANLTSLTPTSAITDNGTISFTGVAPTTFANDVSGTGSIDLSGLGTVTLTGNNSFSGGTTIASGSTLIAGSANALGANAVTSSGGTFATSSGVTLSSLTMNGAVTLGSDITSTGAQVYNGPVTLGQTLTLSAPTSSITFNNTVGDTTTTYASYVAKHNANTINIYNFIVLASRININADITTYGTQTYGSASNASSVYIGDNGTNGRIRTLVSEDPAVTFWGTIDDATANTHTLNVKAVCFSSCAGNDYPTIDFKSDIGQSAALYSLSATTGQQQTTGSPVFTDTSPNSANYVGTVSIMADVTTQSDQTYTGRGIVLGDGSANQEQTFKTTGGNVTFNVGTSGLTASNNPMTVTFDLSGGTHSSFAGTGINYIDKGVTVSTTSSSEGLAGLIQVSSNRSAKDITAQTRTGKATVEVLDASVRCNDQAAKASKECL